MKRMILAGSAFFLLCSTPPAWAATPSQEQALVLNHYATLVHSNYRDALFATRLLQEKVMALIDAPDGVRLAEARKAWLQAREIYNQTEAFRFYGGPIDDEHGPEGRINAWPLDEGYIDSVKGKPRAGLVNNRKQALSRKALIALNEKGGEENIATGWHAIEFMLWGQDFDSKGPGARDVSDFIDGKSPNADRRRQYLQLITEQLVDDMAFLTEAWAPDSNNYRSRFVRNDDSIRLILTGLGVLSRGELAGERMEVALDTQNQEDEHSCFSDNTHRDIVQDARGIENVWLGRYLQADGKLLQGPAIRDLVKAKDAALAERVTHEIANTVTSAEAIQAPFDQEIIGKNDAPGRKRVIATVNALKRQANSLVEAARALGIKRLNTKA